MRIASFARVGVAAALALSLSACGEPYRPDEEAVEPEVAETAPFDPTDEADVSDPVVAEESEEPAHDPLSGRIVLLACATEHDGPWSLEAIDPLPGAESERLGTFATAGYTVALEDTLGPCATGPTTLLRQLFDRDFERMAVTQEVYEDGSSHVGYVERDGGFVDLTPAGGGYADAPREKGAVFRPGTTELFARVYTRADSLEPPVWRTVRIDAETGARTSARDRRASGDANWNTLSHDVVVFGPRGNGVTSYDIESQGSYLLNPSGSLGVKGAYEDSLDVRPAAKIGADGDFMRRLREGCEPAGWLTNESLVCVARAQIYRVGVAGGAAAQAPVLPRVSNRDTHDVLPSPDGTNLAFLSQQGGTVTLFLVPSDGSEQPVEIAQVPAGTRLVHWAP